MTANFKLRAPSKSEAKILQAAFDLFARKGYAATSVDRIAAKARVSKGLIYHYFPSKEALLKALCASLLRGSGILERYERSEPPEQYLKNMIRQSFELIRKQPRLLRLLLSLAVQPAVVRGLGSELENLRRQLLAQLTPVFAALGYSVPELEAYQLIALFDGAGLACLTLKDYPINDLQSFIERKYNL